MMLYFVAETDSPGNKLRFGMPLACIHAIVTLLPIVYFRQQLPKPLFSVLTFFCSGVPIRYYSDITIIPVLIHTKALA